MAVYHKNNEYLIIFVLFLSYLNWFSKYVGLLWLVLNSRTLNNNSTRCAELLLENLKEAGRIKSK